MSGQSGRKDEVVHRIDALEELIKSQGSQLAKQGSQLVKLYNLVSKMKDNFDSMLGVSESRTPRFQAVYGVSERKPNPWALETSRFLTQAMSAVDSEHMNKRLERLFETYKPTIDSLRSASKGLTADEVREKTGRSRNTESTYLWRLYLAGYLTRERRRRKVIYKLKNTKELKQVFGEH